jgi:hypothetical protein
MNAAMRTFSCQMAIVLACGAFSIHMPSRFAQAADADCGFATSTDPCCGDCAGMSCGECCNCCGYGHCTSIWAEFLFLHPTGADVAHAQQQNGTGGAGTVPFGVIGTADPHYEPGFRLGAVIGLSPCSSLAVSYSFLETDAASTVVAPVVPGGGGAVGSLVHHPGIGIISSAGPVDSTYEIDTQMADIEYRRLWMGDSRAWINYSVGARYAHLEQEFFQTGVFSGAQAGLINTQTTADFDGGGALFGLDGECLFGSRGFSFYGNAGVSPVVGQFTTFYTVNNATADVLLANVLWKDDRFVTILDFELGFAWTSASGAWRISSGYLAQFWYNTITTPEFIDAVQANNYTDVGDTLSFDGATARLEYRF